VCQSCDSGISVLNWYHSWDKFVNTHLSHSEHEFNIHSSSKDVFIFHTLPMSCNCSLTSGHFYIGTLSIVEAIDVINVRENILKSVKNAILSPQIKTFET